VELLKEGWSAKYIRLLSHKTLLTRAAAYEAQKLTN
jgi:hypothetical protein